MAKQLASPQTLFMQEQNPNTKHQGIFKSDRLTNVACIDIYSKTIFEWPPSAKKGEYMAKGDYLTGFENNCADGRGSRFNLILTNEDRSTQRDAHTEYYDHMMPERSHTMIRSVSIHHAGFIYGFSFLDKEGALLWSIGETEPWIEVNTVLI
jgi:hypothetical protein